MISSTRARASGGRPASFGSSRASSAWRMVSNRSRSATTVGMISRDCSHAVNRVDLFVDDRLGPLELAGPPREVLLHDALEVVDVVEEDLLEIADAGFDVARQRDVDDEERRAGGAAASRPGRDARVSTGSTAPVAVIDDVGGGQRVAELVPRHRAAVELRAPAARRLPASGWRS